MSTVSGTFAKVESVSVTGSGNVVRRITLDDGRQYLTAPNSSSSFDAANLRPGHQLVLTLNATGRIIRVEVL